MTHNPWDRNCSQFREPTGTFEAWFRSWWPIIRKCPVCERHSPDSRPWHWTGESMF